MVFDSVADEYLGSPRMAALFDARATVAAMLEFEAALAQAQAELGLIPAPAAAVIASCCAAEAIDIAGLKQALVQSSSAVVPLVEQLTAQVGARDADAARYVHWGSSTQDVMDSALMVQARAGLTLITTTLAAASTRLCKVVVGERDTPMVARTLAQHAGPSLFGYKAALWLDALLDARAALLALSQHLPLQFGGATGTLAAYGAHGRALAESVARRLALRATLPWHTQRSVIRRLAAELANGGQCVGKIGHDLLLLQQSEVEEVQEGGGARGGSSALPHKRNPVASIAIVAGAGRVPGQLATVFGAYAHGHERAAGAWHTEWQALRELFVIVASMCDHLLAAVDGVEVNRAALARHLARAGDRNMTEAVAMALAPRLGRSRAQSAVKRVLARGGDFAHALAADAEVSAVLSPAELACALDPAQFVGAAPAFIDDILARSARAGVAEDTP
jgi:3-carboxy-cis,cis-muconate cycloisomerase